MSKISKFAFILLVVFAGVVFAKVLIRGETMSVEKVKEKWGSEPIDYEKFKSGDEQVRAKMAFAILNDKSLLGKDVQFIREKLGRPNGFYFIDAYPAYFVQRGKSHDEDSWQIVFTLNRKYQVDNIFVHKNCCVR